MSRAKRAIAAKMLHDAYLHLCDYKLNETRAAHDVLMEAERRVKNGFSTPDRAYWLHDIDTTFQLWPASLG